MLVADSATTYDKVGNITNILSTNSLGVTYDQFHYVLDSADRSTSETDTQGGASSTTTYSYDSNGQLTNAATAGVSTLTYGYDANGNRNTGSDTVTTGNQMSADANWTYKYDNNGNLTAKNSTWGPRVGPMRTAPPTN